MVREGDLKLPVQWPPQPITLSKKSISLNLTAAINLGENKGADQESIALFREEALKAYTDSGLFSSVVTTSEPADIRADISILEEGSAGLQFLSGFISGFTFTLIPGYASVDVKTKTIYRDRDQKTLASIDHKEQLGFWIQLFLLFAMPFNDGPKTVEKNAHYDLHRVTIHDGHTKGVF